MVAGSAPWWISYLTHRPPTLQNNEYEQNSQRPPQAAEDTLQGTLRPPPWKGQHLSICPSQPHLKTPHFHLLSLLIYPSSQPHAAGGSICSHFHRMTFQSDHYYPQNHPHYASTGNHNTCQHVFNPLKKFTFPKWGESASYAIPFKPLQ